MLTVWTVKFKMSLQAR